MAGDYTRLMQKPERIIYMDAVMTPNAALSPKAFGIVMALVGIFSFAAGMLYLTVGAWPVAGFFGLDALAIWCAFRLSFRAQDQATRVTVDAVSVRLHHRQRGKPDREVALPTGFVRIELDEPLTPSSRLRIEHGATAYVIGRFLMPEERRSFAAALRAAVRRARGERFPLPGTEAAP